MYLKLKDTGQKCEILGRIARNLNPLLLLLLFLLVFLFRVLKGFFCQNPGFCIYIRRVLVHYNEWIWYNLNFSKFKWLDRLCYASFYRGVRRAFRNTKKCDFARTARMSTSRLSEDLANLGYIITDENKYCFLD